MRLLVAPSAAAVADFEHLPQDMPGAVHNKLLKWYIPQSWTMLLSRTRLMYLLLRHI